MDQAKEKRLQGKVEQKAAKKETSLKGKIEEH